MTDEVLFHKKYAKVIKIAKNKSFILKSENLLGILEYNLGKEYETELGYRQDTVSTV